MKEFFDFDPLRGIVRYTEADGDDLVMRAEQDLQPVVDSCQRLANAGARDGGIKAGWWHVADVPPVIWMEIKAKHNCDIFTGDDAEFERFLRILKSDYPKFFTTHKRVA